MVSQFLIPYIFKVILVDFAIENLSLEAFLEGFLIGFDDLFDQFNAQRSGKE